VIYDELMIAKMGCHFLDQDLRGDITIVDAVYEATNRTGGPQLVDGWMFIVQLFAVHQKGHQQESEQMGSFIF